MRISLIQFCWLPLAVFSVDSYFSFSSAVFVILSNTLRLHVLFHPLQPVSELYPAPHLSPVSSESLSAQLLLLCPGCLLMLPSHDGVHLTDPWRSLCFLESVSLCVVGVTSWEVTSHSFLASWLNFPFQPSCSVSELIFNPLPSFLYSTPFLFYGYVFSGSRIFFFIYICVLFSP